MRCPPEVNFTSPGESSAFTEKPCLGIALTTTGTPPVQRTRTVPPTPTSVRMTAAGVVARGVVGVGRALVELLPVSGGAGSDSAAESSRPSGATALRTACIADQDTPRVRVAATTQPAAASGPVRMRPSLPASGRPRAKPG